jgi:hypothetical protein
MEFPSAPAVVAVIVTCAPLAVAVTPTLPPFEAIAEARFVASVASVELTFQSTLVWIGLANSVNVWLPFVITSVCPDVGVAVNVPIARAGIAVADPAKLVV